jgi:hypothetical protein
LRRAADGARACEAAGGRARSVGEWPLSLSLRRTML